MSVRRLAPWLPNYVKAWGPTAGLATFARVGRMVAGNSDQPLPLPLPNMDRTVWLRPAAHDINILQQVWVKREYDFRDMPQYPAIATAYAAAVRQGQRPFIMDCGAHIGLSVLWWHHLFPEAQIVAVEPSSANVAVLRRNLDGLPNVTILHGAVADTDGALKILDTGVGMSAFQVGASGVGAAVQAWSLNTIMANAGASECLLVKVDIEGGEDVLFRSNLQWLDRTRCMAVELHDWLRPWTGQTRTLFQATSARPFDYVMQGENMLCFQQLN